MEKLFKFVYDRKVLIIVLLIFYFIFKYMFCIVIVNGDSMFPNLKENEALIINKINTKDIKKGQIVIFKEPNLTTNNVDVIAKNDFKNIYCIKRVIAIGGEYIEFKNDSIYINGEQIKEKYIDTGMKTFQNNETINNFIVPEHYVFVMGDNRTNSLDSRNFGCIPISQIKGRVFLRIFPLTRFTKM